MHWNGSPLCPLSRAKRTANVNGRLHNAVLQHVGCSRRLRRASPSQFKHHRLLNCRPTSQSTRTGAMRRPVTFNVMGLAPCLTRFPFCTFIAAPRCSAKHAFCGHSSIISALAFHKIKKPPPLIIKFLTDNHPVVSLHRNTFWNPTLRQLFVLASFRSSGHSSPLTLRSSGSCARKRACSAQLHVRTHPNCSHSKRCNRKMFHVLPFLSFVDKSHPSNHPRSSVLFWRTVEYQLFARGIPLQQARYPSSFFIWYCFSPKSLLFILAA